MFTFTRTETAQREYFLSRRRRLPRQDRRPRQVPLPRGYEVRGEVRRGVRLDEEEEEVRGVEEDCVFLRQFSPLRNNYERVPCVASAAKCEKKRDY